MSLDWSWFLSWLNVLLCLSDLLDESGVLVLKSSLESSSLSGWEELDELIIGECDQIVDFLSSEGEFSESSFLRETMTVSLIMLTLSTTNGLVLEIWWKLPQQR